VNAVVEVKELPAPVARRGITEPQWRTAMNSLFPGAKPESVIAVFDYCKARGLDPLKKPCHIVPMQVKIEGDYVWRDVIMPGIYEYRTTATRTGYYLGHSKPEYGPETDFLGVTAPAFCEIVIYRWNPEAKMRAEYPVRVKFAECCGTAKDRKTGDLYVNGRWSRAPEQMLTKCTEAAGLREAFPDELGGTHTAEEMLDQREPEDVVATISKVNPRGDTSNVDFEARDRWVDDIKRIIESDNEEKQIAQLLRDAAEELNRAPELYIVVLDKLASDKICSKAAWTKWLAYKASEADQIP